MACGVKFANSPPTYGVCGEFAGYASAALSCTAASSCPPFFCETYKEVIVCQGVDHLSGYNQAPGTVVCGCPDWEKIGIDAPPISPCSSSNRKWDENSLQFLVSSKSGCPSAYSYPYDDFISTCMGDDAREYVVEFCPGHSEPSFFGESFNE